MEAKETVVVGAMKDTEESVQVEAVEEDANVTPIDRYTASISKDLASATEENTPSLEAKDAPSTEETTVLIQLASIENQIVPSTDRSVQVATSRDTSTVGVDDDDTNDEDETQVTFNDENSYVDEEPNEEKSENVDPLEYKRIDTMHAQLKIPLSAKSGDCLDINHGGTKSIKVPTGQQGKSITVKMVQNEKEEVPSTGFICCM